MRTPMVWGRLEDGKLEEASGLAPSRTHDGVFWLHNDSGGKPRLFAVSKNGADLGRVDISGAGARDWEDIALIPGDDGDHLLIGDIGDNKEKRETVQLYRVPEPRPGLDREVPAERMEVRYPKGPKNAETLLVDPRDGVIYILTKSKKGHSALYRVGVFEPGEVTAEEVGSYDFPKGYSSAKATGGDISPDRKWLAIRTYAAIWMFPIDDALPGALAAEPCELKTADEEQGESIGFVDGGLVTISEGEGAPVHFLPLR